MNLKGYESYYVAANMEADRTTLLSIKSETPLDVYDYTSGQILPSSSKWSQDGYETEFLAELPSYGYCVFGTKARKPETGAIWKEGDSISSGNISVRAKGNIIEVNDHGRTYILSLDEFNIRFLGQIHGNDTTGTENWRESESYGPVRTSVREGIYPQLRIDRQPDWLVHLRQTVSIVNGRVVVDMDFDFPHPTLVRCAEAARSHESTFDPRGLNLKISTFGKGIPSYDMPYGIATLDFDGTSHLCPLSTCIFQKETYGLMVSARSGEQGMTVNADEGDITVYLGASTTSGPAKDLGIEYPTPTSTLHKTAWYAEPFHGKYHHTIILGTWEGDWSDAHTGASIRNLATPVYLRKCTGNDATHAEALPTSASWIKLNTSAATVTMADYTETDGFFIRLNECDGKGGIIHVECISESRDIKISPFGTITVTQSLPENHIQDTRQR
ncbi:MAG: hypothetical protein KBS57_06060 [Alistipes sp.]|nr:hypothetical protein [Candidatus Minthomonas equi]